MIKFIVCIFLACVLFPTGETIKCYFCTSIEPTCREDFNATGIQYRDCNGTGNACMKLVYTNGNIERSCGQDGGDDYDDGVDTCDLFAQQVFIDSCVTCVSDYCNGSNKTYSASMLFLILVAGLALLQSQRST